MGENEYKPILPDTSKRFEPAIYTQEIAVTNGRDRIDKVEITDLPDRRWHQSGGMQGIDRSLWKSEKYRSIPGGVEPNWIANISVRNSLGYMQNNRGIVRQYPDGTRFDDVLSNADGKVFEHRVREKKDGRWKSTVVYSDPAARPKGYEGLKVTCASCHDQAGTGNYAAGLVPGGDTILSDPLEWDRSKHREP